MARQDNQFVKMMRMMEEIRLWLPNNPPGDHRERQNPTPLPEGYKEDYEEEHEIVNPFAGYGHQGDLIFHIEQLLG